MRRAIVVPRTPSPGAPAVGGAPARRPIAIPLASPGLIGTPEPEPAAPAAVTAPSRRCTPVGGATTAAWPCRRSGHHRRCGDRPPARPDATLAGRHDRRHRPARSARCEAVHSIARHRRFARRRPRRLACLCLVRGRAADRPVPIALAAGSMAGVVPTVPISHRSPPAVASAGRHGCPRPRPRAPPAHPGAGRTPPSRVLPARRPAGRAAPRAPARAPRRAARPRPGPRPATEAPRARVPHRRSTTLARRSGD